VVGESARKGGLEKGRTGGHTGDCGQGFFYRNFRRRAGKRCLSKRT